MRAEGEFTCERCGGTFPKAWSDEEALAETEALFPGEKGDLAVICDQCFQPFSRWLANLRERGIADLKKSMDP